MRGGPDTAAPEFGRRAKNPMPPLAPPDYRTVPVEMILFQANATGQMFLRRWRSRGARFKRDARVWRVGERLVGQVDFEEPIDVERQDGGVVQLSTILWENLS